VSGVQRSSSVLAINVPDLIILRGKHAGDCGMA
jgi:hypothetical protein